MTISVKPFSSLSSPPSNASGLITWLRSLYTSFQEVRQGKLSCAFTGTFDTNAASTAITNKYLTKQSVVIFNALDAAANTILVGGVYATEANRDNEAWTLTHINLGGGAGGLFIAAIIG